MGPATSAPGSASAEARQPASPAERDRYSERAEAICRDGLRETRVLGRGLPKVLASSDSPQKGITNGLVRPGTEILSREATKLRNLEPVPNSRALEVYLGLFEPIVELARQRLEAGVGDPEQARKLELMITSLEDEQSAAARQFGLEACAVEFIRALGGSG